MISRRFHIVEHHFIHFFLLFCKKRQSLRLTGIYQLKLGTRIINNNHPRSHGTNDDLYQGFLQLLVTRLEYPRSRLQQNIHRGRLAGIFVLNRVPTIGIHDKLLPHLHAPAAITSSSYPFKDAIGSARRYRMFYRHPAILQSSDLWLATRVRSPHRHPKCSEL